MGPEAWGGLFFRPFFQDATSVFSGAGIPIRDSAEKLVGRGVPAPGGAPWGPWAPYAALRDCAKRNVRLHTKCTLCCSHTRPLVSPNSTSVVSPQHKCSLCTSQKSLQKHEFGPERGRHGSVRPETLRGESHAPPDAYGMPNGPKSPKIRRKTGETPVLGPGPYARCGTARSAIYACKNHCRRASCRFWYFLEPAVTGTYIQYVSRVSTRAQ